MVSFHFGSWEIYSAIAGLLKIPYCFAVKEQHRHARLNLLLNHYRETFGAKAIPTGIQTRDLIKALDRNEVVGILLDQGGKGGARVSFFQRQASYHTGAIRLALRKGVPVIFSALVRTGADSYRVIFHEPLDLKDSGNPDEDVKRGVIQLVSGFQSYVELYPREYLWFHKIWKYPREVHVLILQDGKTGHVKQSRMVAQCAQRIAEDAGWNYQLHEVAVDFKSRWHHLVFEALMVFPKIGVGGPRMRMLKFFLTPLSWQALNVLTPDWVISCGAALAGLNVYFTKACQAHNMAIQKTGLQPVNNFHTVFLPQHDAAKCVASRHVVVTKGAPNVIDKPYLVAQEKKFLERFSHLKNSSRSFVGLFVGGDSRTIFISESQIRVLSHQLKSVLRDFQTDLILTTSRRTPARLEQILNQEFRKDDICRLMILANQNNVPEAVGGILSLSKVVIVSGDSISMISEAATSGKTTIVFMAEERKTTLPRQNKHRRFIEHLHDQGHIITTTASCAGQTLAQVLQGKLQTTPLRDRVVIEDRLRKCFLKI